MCRGRERDGEKEKQRDLCWSVSNTASSPTATNPYLLLANQGFILRSDLNGSNLEIVLTYQPNALGIDYHYRLEHALFHMHAILRTIALSGVMNSLL